MIDFLQNKTLPTVVNVLIVAIMGYVCSMFVWSWVTPAPTAVVTVATPNAQIPIKPYERYGQKISNLHVFGLPEAPKPVKTVVAKPENAPKTRLNLTLKGVLAHSDPNNAFALIGQGSGPQKVYGVGDKLPGSAELLKVFKDRVIIKYQQREETLFLEKRKGINLAMRQPSRPALPIAPLNSTRQTFSPQRATQVRQDLLANPSKLFNMVGVEPHRNASGNVIGYRLMPKGDGALFTEAGLQPGDVVMAVNGISITDNAGLNGLSGNESRYDVTILRQGAEVSLSVDFN